MAVIRALKATSRVKNHSGATPLHIAASHRCSAESLTVLIEEASKQQPDVQDSMSKGSVSPTADLSRIGRAPIHYACMSYRGLDLKAFQVLFEASLREGVVVTSPDKGFGLDDFAEDDLLDDDIYQADDSDVGADVQVNVLGLKDATGETPLSLLFRRYRERVKVRENRILFQFDGRRTFLLALSVSPLQWCVRVSHLLNCFLAIGCYSNCRPPSSPVPGQCKQGGFGGCHDCAC